MVYFLSTQLEKSSILLTNGCHNTKLLLWHNLKK